MVVFFDELHVFAHVEKFQLHILKLQRGSLDKHLSGKQKRNKWFSCEHCRRWYHNVCQVFWNENIYQYADAICQDFLFPRRVTLVLLLNILRIVLESLREKNND